MRHPLASLNKAIAAKESLSDRSENSELLCGSELVVVRVSAGLKMWVQLVSISSYLPTIWNLFFLRRESFLMARSRSVLFLRMPNCFFIYYKFSEFLSRKLNNQNNVIFEINSSVMTRNYHG